MRRSAFAIVIALLVSPLAFPYSTNAAAPKAGAKCTKVNSKVTSKGLTFTCIKSGSKLVWSKGVKETKTASPNNSTNGSNNNSNNNSIQPNVNLGDSCPTKDLKGSIPNGTAICTSVNGKLIWEKMGPPGQQGNSSNNNQGNNSGGNNSGNNSSGNNNSNSQLVNFGDSCNKKGETAPISGGTAICASSDGKLIWTTVEYQKVPADGVWLYLTPGSDKWNTDLPPDNWKGEASWFESSWDIPTTVPIAPKCTSNNVLSHYITDLDGLASITPQGFMQPGAHNLPVPHMYYNTGATTEKDPNGVAYKSKIVNMYAPADMTLYGASKQTYTMSDGYQYTEWMMTWHFCGTYWMFNAHIGWIAPDVQAAIDSAPLKKCQTGGQLNTKSEDCYSARFAYTVKAGTLFAKSSGRAHGFDFGFTDASKPDPKRINPAYFAPRWAAGGCHINYYPAEMRSKIEVKLDGNNGCGQLVSDVAGTAQGVWFNPAHHNRNESVFEDYHIALAKNWADKDLLTFSIGWNADISGLSGGRFNFKPSATGPSNKAFTEVKNNEIMCYDSLTGTGRNGEAAPTLYIKMSSGSVEKLTIAKGSGVCGAGPYTMPDNSKTFERKVES